MRLDLLVMILVTLRTWFCAPPPMVGVENGIVVAREGLAAAANHHADDVPPRPHAVSIADEVIAHRRSALQHAIIAETLQTILISNEVSEKLALSAWVTIFDRVLLPMLGGRHHHTTHHHDPHGAASSLADQNLASNLVAKVFCCHAETLSSLLPKVMGALIRDYIDARDRGGMTDSQIKDHRDSFTQRLMNLCRVVVDRVDPNDWSEAVLLLDGLDGVLDKGWRDELGR
jgi:hypothetical protein